jgi:hypothetical protein
MLFTVKPPAPQPPNGKSTGQLSPTVKSVGGGKENVPHGAKVTVHVSVGVAVGVGVGVPNGGVGGGVGVGVTVDVTSGDLSALGAIAREEPITAAASATTAPARIANVVDRLIEPLISLCRCL